MRFLFLLFIMAILGTAFNASMAGENKVTGTWIGIINWNGQERSYPVRFNFPDNPQESNGTVSLPLGGISNQQLTGIDIQSPEIRITFMLDKKMFSFHGSSMNGSISGDVTLGEIKGTFELVRTINLDLQKYYGTYKDPSGNHVYIRTWDELGKNQLTYFDDEGRTGALYPVTERESFSGPSLFIPLPVQRRILFQEDQAGKVTGLSWIENGRAPVEMKKVFTHKEEEITFRSNDVLLSGSLVIPSDKGPFPSIVLVHGSGPVTRDFFGPIAYLFARHGIAVLSYDKRGIRKSDHHWMDAGFEDYATDTLAGVEYLKTRNEIDPTKIGLWGASQAGWVIPQAIERSNEIAFAVLISVPAVTPAEQEMQRLKEELVVQGASKEQIDEAISAHRSQLQNLRSAEAQTELEKELRQLQKDPTQAELLNASGLQNPRFLLFFRRIMDYSAIPSLQKITCPVLVLYGELDRAVPPAENRPLLESALQKSGTDVSFHSFPKGNHALMLSDTGSSAEFPYLNQFVRGLFQVMVDWIHKHTKLPVPK